MIYDVEVIISASETSGQAGSWFPLIYVSGEEKKYAEYSSMTAVMEDYAAETDAYKVANLLFMQDNAPSKIAICAGAEDVKTGIAEYINRDWRQLIVVNSTKKYDATLAAYIETTEKMYFTHFASTEEATSAKITDYDRTVGIVYTHADTSYPEAAIVGRMAGYEAGEGTYHAKEVKGVTADDFSETELEAIHAAGCFAYVEKNGRTATSNGITGSGEYIDVVESFDYLKQNIRFNVQEVFLNNAKVPYTNAGIAMIESAVLNVLVKGYNNGMIATDDDGKACYSTNFVPRSGTTAEDRASRNYPYGTFEFELAGAIHKAKPIKGIVIA